MTFRSILCVLLFGLTALGCLSCDSDAAKDGETATPGASASSADPATPADPIATAGDQQPAQDPSADPADTMTQQPESAPTAYNELTDEERYIILEKGTERPGTGALLGNKAAGTYICRQCNAPLYGSKDKFESHCGWPSFDDEIEGAVLRRPEPSPFDNRTEIVCNNCGGHLGHVFLGEGFTEKNTRHCVNSVSMRFVPEGEELPAKIVLER